MPQIVASVYGVGLGFARVTAHDDEGVMTLAGLAEIMCLASGIFGRSPWDADKCLERAAYVQQAAVRYSVDPLLMVAVEIYECDMQDRDAPIYEIRDGVKQVVGYDACPMGVRVRGVSERKKLGPRELYDRAAVLLSTLSVRRTRHRTKNHIHFVAGYNAGNPTYAHQILSVRRGLDGKDPRPGDREALTPRTLEILKRLRRALSLAEDRKNS